jgi:hypothetical protein
MRLLHKSLPAENALSYHVAVANKKGFITFDSVLKNIFVENNIFPLQNFSIFNAIFGPGATL